MIKMEVFGNSDEMILVLNTGRVAPLGKVALLVNKSGKVYKAVYENLINSQGNKVVNTVIGKFKIFEELGKTKHRNNIYYAIKMPYCSAVWQPYKHQLVAYAFGLLTESWQVINHIGGTEYGDSLQNLEAVSTSENNIHGKFRSVLMDDFGFIKAIAVSAKHGENLKYFRDGILQCIYREIDNIETDEKVNGYHYKMLLDHSVLSGNDLTIYGNLKVDNYDEKIVLHVDVDEYRNWQLLREVQ